MSRVAWAMVRNKRYVIKYLDWETTKEEVEEGLSRVAGGVNFRVRMSRATITTKKCGWDKELAGRIKILTVYCRMIEPSKNYRQKFFEPRRNPRNRRGPTTRTSGDFRSSSAANFKRSMRRNGDGQNTTDHRTKRSIENSRNRRGN